MKWLRVGLLFFVIYNLLCPMDARAEISPYVPPPVLVDSPVIISAYAAEGPNVLYVQLFNTLDKPVNLSGWRIARTLKDGTEVNIGSLNSWMLPSNYILASSSISGADFLLKQDNLSTTVSLQIKPPVDSGYASHIVIIDKDGEYRRKTSAKTGEYLSTFELAGNSVLYGGGFYEYLQETGLIFSEILANPRICSPADQAADCIDYVKIYNPTIEKIDLAQFRLRVGYKGQNATSSNTYRLEGLLDPGHYATISRGSDSQNINITNSGGYVWLEDIYGIKQYDSTIQPFGDASAESKRGFAWAYDMSDGMWKWTEHPTPEDSPSVFIISADSKKTTSVVQYTPCEAGEYRSEETHRCRSLASLITSTLAACPVGQYRSEETNRCRKAEAATSVSECPAGQERNPDTNRCRKIEQVLGASNFSVDPVAEAGKGFVGWWTIGGIGTLAAGYGVWEWRKEAANAIRKIGTFFTSSK